MSRVALPRSCLITDGCDGDDARRASTRRWRRCRAASRRCSCAPRRSTARALLEAARALRAVTRARRRCCFVNDRVDVALAAGADGVHLPARGLPLGAARAARAARCSSASRPTRSTRRATAARGGADYVVFGPVCATPSKAASARRSASTRSPRWSRALPVPVFALGGVDAERARRRALAAGARVACIGAVLGAGDAAAGARALAAAIALTIAAIRWARGVIVAGGWRAGGRSAGWRSSRSTSRAPPSDDMAPELRKGDLLLACRVCGEPAARRRRAVHAARRNGRAVAPPRRRACPATRSRCIKGQILVNGQPLVDERRRHRQARRRRRRRASRGRFSVVHRDARRAQYNVVRDLDVHARPATARPRRSTTSTSCSPIAARWPATAATTARCARARIRSGRHARASPPATTTPTARAPAALEEAHLAVVVDGQVVAQARRRRCAGTAADDAARRASGVIRWIDLVARAPTACPTRCAGGTATNGSRRT